LKNTWGLQILDFSLLAATNLGNGCLVFLVHEKETQIQEGLGFFLCCSNSINGHLAFFIHEKVTQVQEGPIFSSMRETLKSKKAYVFFY
jgi:hypothetical protein